MNYGACRRVFSAQGNVRYTLFIEKRELHKTDQCDPILPAKGDKTQTVFTLTMKRGEAETYSKTHLCLLSPEWGLHVIFIFLGLSQMSASEHGLL